MKRILLASRSLFPCYKGGSAFVTESLAASFDKEELVVVGGRFFLGEDTRFNRKPDVKFIYLPTEIHIRNRGHKYFKLIRWLLVFPFFVRQLYNIVKKEKIDYIVGTFPDNFYLFGSYWVSKWANVPFSSYFHNTYMENRRGIDRWWAGIVQERVFNQSEHIFVMSEGMGRYYNKKYNWDKFVPLTHSFDEYPEGVKPTEWQQKKKWKLVLIGNFNYSNLDATRFLFDALKDSDEYEIVLCTKVPTPVLESKGLNMKNVTNLGFVPDDDLFPTLQKNDIAVVTHGFGGKLEEVEYETIFPTRTIPLLLSGKPLLVLSPGNAYYSEFIRNRNCGELVEEKDKALLMKALGNISRNPQRHNELVANASKAAETFYGKTVIQTFKRKIRETRAAEVR